MNKKTFIWLAWILFFMSLLLPPIDGGYKEALQGWKCFIMSILTLPLWFVEPNRFLIYIFYFIPAFLNLFLFIVPFVKEKFFPVLRIVISIQLIATIVIIFIPKFCGPQLLPGNYFERKSLQPRDTLDRSPSKIRE